MKQTSYCPVAIVQTDTVTAFIDPPLQGILIFKAGDISFINERGTTLTRTIPSAANGASLPCVLPIRIRQVLDTGTTLADADMLGLVQA